MCSEFDYIIIQVMMIVKATSVLISPDMLGGNQPLELIKVVLIPDDKYGLVNSVFSFCIVSIAEVLYVAMIWEWMLLILLRVLKYSPMYDIYTV